MYSGRVKTRAQGVALVRASSVDTEQSYHYENTSSIIRHEPNKAAVKLNLQTNRRITAPLVKTPVTKSKSSNNKTTISTPDSTKSDVSPVSRSSFGDGGSRQRRKDKLPPEIRYSSPEPLETPQSETNDFYTSKLSLEWPMDQTVLEETPDQLPNVTNSQMKPNEFSSPRLRLSTPPPLPKLKPINVVDPVLSHSSETLRAHNGVGDTLGVEPLAPSAGEDSLKLQLERVRKELDSQIQVNVELKKMLVASMGDDLPYRLERLVRDKAQLSQEVGQFSQRVTEDYEELDQISIQADMWRSKYMASKVMVDEMANMKAQLQMKFQESEAALMQLIEERHELNRVLGETHGFLKHIRDAFEPANATSPMPTVTCNTLMLADICKSQAENVHVRLLPGGKSALPHVGRFVQCQPTQGEAMASDIIMRPEDTGQPQYTLHPPRGNMSVPRVDSIPRFHPLTRYENFTIAGCSNCQGEILAI